MPEPKGRRNRRDRERERRRTREPGVPLPEDERLEREAREARSRPPAPRARSAAAKQPAGPPELPSARVRFTGAMVGILTLLGAAYMVIAAVLNGGGADSVVSAGVGVVLFGVGLFASVLSLFPLQVRTWVRRND